MFRTLKHIYIDQFRESKAENHPVLASAEVRRKYAPKILGEAAILFTTSLEVVRHKPGAIIFFVVGHALLWSREIKQRVAEQRESETPEIYSARLYDPDYPGLVI